MTFRRNCQYATAVSVLPKSSPGDLNEITGIGDGALLRDVLLDLG